MKYDLVVFGGGTSGVAAAYIASKHGINTLLVERADVLGGAITQGLVIPSMKVDTQNINTEFFSDLKTYADKYKARITYSDDNEAWFNPQLLKIVLDDMLKSVNCAVLFSTEPNTITYNTDGNVFSLNLSHNLLSLYIDTKYIIDATSFGKIFKILNCNFQNSENKFQNPGMRFVLSGIDINKFADWLEAFDKNRDVTSIFRTDDGQVYLSTSYTSDKSKKWALEPIFTKAADDGVLEAKDSAYFQLFSVPNTQDSVALNCPRIILEDWENPLDPFIYSRSLIQGRQRIYRIYNFCKKYLTGFENSYISDISDVLGIRESYRVKCKYTMTKDDIIKGTKPKNAALSSDYPIDVHSGSKGDKLEFINHNYYLPVDALISDKYDNLYAVGKIVSADFEAQAALRTQMSCFSMGEAAAKDILKKLI